MTHPDDKDSWRSVDVALPRRGQNQLAEFVEAMGFELTDNAHKGDWLEYVMLNQDGTVAFRRPMSDAELLSDALYHLVKLGRAMARGDRAAIHEYAADVGNCAMFCADQHNALDPQLAHVGAIEYDKEANTDAAWPSRAATWKGVAADWAHQIMTAMREDAEGAEATP